MKRPIAFAVVRKRVLRDIRRFARLGGMPPSRLARMMPGFEATLADMERDGVPPSAVRLTVGVTPSGAPAMVLWREGGPSPFDPGEPFHGARPFAETVH